MAAETGPAPHGAERAPLSAFVIAYNREQIIGTCLRALAFADELLVIDKGSTDQTAAIAETLADRVIRVPWSPTVEETRGFAAEQCRHDWILFLDDDECLSPEAVRFIDAELRHPRADIYRFPLRHYILGVHDERAYYWPEEHIRLFRRGSVRFGTKVHSGMEMDSHRTYSVPVDDGICIHHLSHRDVEHWIEKSNRYTSRPDRARVVRAGSGIIRFGHERIDQYAVRTDPCEPDSYPMAVALLRATYDLIDGLKTWEEERGLDGAACFQAVCADLDRRYAAELADLTRPRAVAASPETVALPPDTPQVASGTLDRAVAALRDSVQAQRAAVDATQAALRDAHLQLAESRAAETHHQARIDDLLRHAETERQRADREQQRAEHERDRAEREQGRAEREQGRAERAEARAERSEARADETTRALDAADQALSATQDALARAESRIRALEASTSWRITAPLRATMTRLGRRG